MKENRYIKKEKKSTDWTFAIGMFVVAAVLFFSSGRYVSEHPVLALLVFLAGLIALYPLYLAIMRPILARIWWRNLLGLNKYSPSLKVSDEDMKAILRHQQEKQ
jgi:hypothetical protein